MISQDLDRELERAIQKGGTEPAIVKRYTEYVSALKNPPHLRIRAKFIHQSPYAMFVKPRRVAGKVKCELGDILYLYKRVMSNGKLDSIRVAFVQAKQGASSWKIEPHQLYFWKYIRKFYFRFGNCVHVKSGKFTPIFYKGLNVSSAVCYYLLFGPATPARLCYRVDRIARRETAEKKLFSINSHNAICCSFNFPLCAECDSHSQFLAGFFGGMNGVYPSKKLKEVVELIYKKAEWELDPPEEFADNFEEDGRGFGLIEITERVNEEITRPTKGLENS